MVTTQNGTKNIHRRTDMMRITSATDPRSWLKDACSDSSLGKGGVPGNSGFRFPDGGSDIMPDYPPPDP